MQPSEELRRIEARVRPLVGRFLRGPDVTDRPPVTTAAETAADKGKASGPVFGELTLDELAEVVRLACYVTPRSDEEQLLLLKAASEVDHATDAHLMDDVRSSAGFPQRELELPSAVATAAKVAAVGGVLAGCWETGRRLLAMRRRHAAGRSSDGG